MLRFAVAFALVSAVEAARIILDAEEESLEIAATAADASDDFFARYTVTVPGLGDLQGKSAYRLDRSVALFRGIPYAQAPVGDLRWRAPRPYGPWESPRDATYFRDSCMASGIDAPTSEDCLFLNVATPAAAIDDSTAQHSVMIWIHGGTYRSGASREFEIENVVHYAGLPVVVASMNYRINIFGFLGSQSLAERSLGDGTGNYGLQDSRLAMTWLRDHVSAFGGNGGDMTLFGESAGGNAVLHHLAQPASAGLFQKVIIQSGTYDAGLELSDAQAIYAGISEQLGCADVDCLLNKSAEEVLGAKVDFFAEALATLPEVHWGPVVDGVSNTGSAQELIADGQFNKGIPVLIGSLIDEFAAFVPGDSIPRDMTEADFDHAVGYIGAENLRTLKQLYDPSVYEYPSDLGRSNQWWWMAMRVATDNGVPDPAFSKGCALGHCSMRRVAHNLIRGSVPSLHMYSFNKAVYFGEVGHATDLLFTFAMDSISGLPVPHMHLPGYHALSVAMIRYWASFAVNGEPGSPGLAQWPEYTLDGDMPNLRFDGTRWRTNITVEHAFRQQACDFWDGLAVPR